MRFCLWPNYTLKYRLPKIHKYYFQLMFQFRFVLSARTINQFSNQKALKNSEEVSITEKKSVDLTQYHLFITL